MMLSADDVLDLLAVELIGIVPEDENVIIGPIWRAVAPTQKAGQASETSPNV
jgi:septum formation inhibitor-activating ATPase MinD